MADDTKVLVCRVNLPTCSYPNIVDSFVNPLDDNMQAAPNHAKLHSKVNDAVQALEQTVGAGGNLVFRFTRRVVEAFENGDLAGGILTLTHNLNASYPTVQVFDNSENMITPDEITYVNVNSCTVDLSSWGAINGTWHVSVVGGY